MTRMWFAIATLAAGCTSFDTLTRDQCGNGLLEAGEDCDSQDASCIRCAVTCVDGSTCPTTDYRCGVDGYCHAPGGAVGLPVAGGAFQVSDYEVSDVDGDGIGDVLGLSRTSVVVRHGDASGAVTSIDAVLTPAQTGPGAFGDIDGDGSIDVTITTEDGLVSYASPYGTVSPLVVQSSLVDDMSGQPIDLRYAFGITPFTLGAFAVDSDHIALIVADFGSNALTAAIPCNTVISPADFVPSMITVYQVNRDTDLAADTVVAMVTGVGASAKVCVIAIHKDNLLATSTITNIPPAMPPSLSHRPVLADLDNDGDRCPDLVTSEAGAGGLRHYDGGFVGGHCILRGAAVGGDVLPAVVGTPPMSVAVGRVPLDPLVVGVAPDALLLSEGVYAFIPSGPGFQVIYHSTRKLSGAASSDLNDDGLIDSVLIADGADDLDLLYRYPLFAAFRLYRIDTASEVTSVTLDDFDGNGIKDIAYSERLTDHQRMMVVYSTPDVPLDPVAVGTFVDIESVVRAQLPDHVDVLAQAADLLVLGPPIDGNPPNLTALHGSPQRTMIPYFDPRSGVRQGDTLFRGAVVGQFAPTPGGGKEYTDLVAIAPPSADVSGATLVRAWSVPGTKSGPDATQTGGVSVTGVADCTNAAGGSVCIQDVAYVALPSSPTRDLVLAIDRSAPPHIATIDPWSASGGTIAAMPSSVIASKVPPGNVVHSLHVGDVDGDGAADLIAAFEPSKRATPGTGVLLVCKLSAGVPSSCEDVMPAIAAATTTPPEECVDAVPGRLSYRDPTVTADPTYDLVALCHDAGTSLYRVHHDAAGYHADVIARSATHSTAVRIGDVTGDGVDDIVVLEGDSGSQSVTVYRQCTSRDVASCQGAKAKEAP